MQYSSWKVYRKDDKQRVWTLGGWRHRFCYGDRCWSAAWVVLTGCLDFERRGWSRSRYQTHSCVLYTLTLCFQRQKNYCHNEPNDSTCPLFVSFFLFLFFFHSAHSIAWPVSATVRLFRSDRSVSMALCAYLHRCGLRDHKSLLELSNLMKITSLFIFVLLFRYSM